MPQVKFEKVSARDLGSNSLMRMVGSERGQLLRFTDAILARAETNKNKDHVDDAGITQIAATLPLLALDVEHRPTEIVGYFTDARNVNSALVVDGIVFADRFPDVAEDLMAGRTYLSVEASAKFASCSMCGKQFTHENDYCNCLKNRLRGSGAARVLSELQAVGGGVTKNPAGTNTGFDTNRVEFLASLQEPEPEIVEEPMKIEPGAARAAQRLFANFQAALAPETPTGAAPQLNTYRPVFAPFLAVEWEPAFIAELANKVVEAMKPMFPATAATTMEAATIEEVKAIVAEKLGETKKEEETKAEVPPTVTASAKPVGVGLMGIAWDAPNTHPVVKATW